MNEKYDCIIIGGGISGLSASIHLKRAGISTLIIEKNIPGGLVTKASIIDNYPGLPNISGTELALKIYDQAKSHGVKIESTIAKEIKNTATTKVIITSEKNFEAQIVLIATGRKPEKLNIENEDNFVGRGISYCTTCDAPLFKEQKVVIVGNDENSLKETLYLSSLASQVTYITEQDLFPVDEKLLELIKSKDNIKIMVKNKIISLNSIDDKISSVNLETGEEIDVTGIFCYRGFSPNTTLSDLLRIKKTNKYIKVNDTFETSQKNIFAIGDVIKKDLYTLTTNMSDASIVANNIKNKILENRNQ